MNRCFILLLGIVFIGFDVTAQQRLIDETKKVISSLNPTVETFRAAANKLQPAFMHETTSGKAETWYVGGKVQQGLYDKYMSMKQVGKKVDNKKMGHALLEAFDLYEHALQLDTIYETDKHGAPKIDKKTGKARFKTHYSSDILERLASHRNDFNTVGGELYNIKDWTGAIQSWEVYCRLLRGMATPVADSIIGQARYYQGLAAWQNGDAALAASYFSKARHNNYHKKEAYDYALICLSDAGDEKGIVALAQEAYERFGTTDPQYIRILINDHISRQDLAGATALLDAAEKRQPDDPELLNLKGLVMEKQKGPDAAITYFLQCIEKDPDNVQGLFNVGRYYYNLAATESEKLTGEALRRKVTPLYRKAQPYMERVHALDPTNSDAIEALRTIYYRTGEGRKLQELERKK